MIRAGVLLVALAGSVDAAPCRQALALGLDVSGSVDAREYRLQIEGVAGALGSPEVRAALLSSPEAPVSLMVYEWSGPSDQAVIAPWAVMDGDAALDQLIESLGQTTRRAATPGTALGVAVSLGAVYLREKPECGKRTLDISGDGKSNLGPRPRDVKAAVAAEGITVNALVIGAEASGTGDLRQAELGELSSYFRAEVIAGPDAFVETAQGFAAYEAAMTRKLLRELEVRAIADLSLD